MTLASRHAGRPTNAGRGLTRTTGEALPLTFEDAVIAAVDSLVPTYGQESLPTATDLSRIARYIVTEAQDRDGVLPGLGLRSCRLASSLVLPAAAVDVFLAAGVPTGSIGTCRFNRFSDAITATTVSTDDATIVVVAIPSGGSDEGTPSALAHAAGDAVLTVQEARQRLDATTDGRWVRGIAAIATEIALANPDGGYSDITIGPRRLAPTQHHAPGWGRSPLKALLQEVFHTLSRRWAMPETLWTRTAVHPRLRSGWAEPDHLVVIAIPPVILDRTQRIEAAEVARSRLIKALEADGPSSLLTRVKAALPPGSAWLEDQAVIADMSAPPATRRAEGADESPQRPRMAGPHRTFSRPAHVPTLGELVWWSVIDERATLDDLAALQRAGFADVTIGDPAAAIEAIDIALRRSDRGHLADVVELATSQFRADMALDVDDGSDDL